MACYRDSFTFTFTKHRSYARFPFQNTATATSSIQNAERENEQFTHDTNEKPNLRFMGTIHYCKTEKECGTACEGLM
jgi:hypothetical protein